MGTFHIISGDDYEDYCNYKRRKKEINEEKLLYEDFYNDMIAASTISERITCGLTEILNTMTIDNYKSFDFTRKLKKISNDMFDLFPCRNYIDIELDSRETDDGE